MFKNIFLLVILAFVTVAGCNNANANTDQKSEDKELKSSATSSNDEGGAIHLTKAEFLKRVMDYESNPNEWIYLGDKPAIIDFYASWCPPCKIASPILDELAKEYKGEIYVYKINTDEERELASVFGIRSIPSFLFVPQDGKPTMSNGIASTPEETKKMFKQQIDEYLLGKKAQESL